MHDEFKHGQDAVELAILQVLQDGETLSTKEVQSRARKILDLKPRDISQARKRPNEQKIDQIISNALQKGRNLCSRGLIQRLNGPCFRINNSGVNYLAQKLSDRALLEEAWEGLMAQQG